MNVNRRLLIGFDWLWLLCLLALLGSGVLTLWSTVAGTSLGAYFGRQLLYLAIALLLFLIVLYFDYHLVSDFISIAYILGLAVLVVVLVFGETRHGNKSWLTSERWHFNPRNSSRSSSWSPWPDTTPKPNGTTWNWGNC